MTNRERLSKMALIDMLTLLNEKASHGCITCSYEEDRCEKFENCYDCIAAWLNEEE